MALNRLLLGERDAHRAFAAESAACERLAGRFHLVATLDADTRALPGTVHALAGALLHPLNRPRVENGARRGYAIVQPNMELSASAVKNTRSSPPLCRARRHGRLPPSPSPNSIRTSPAMAPLAARASTMCAPSWQRWRASCPRAASSATTSSRANWPARLSRATSPFTTASRRLSPPTSSASSAGRGATGNCCPSSSAAAFPAFRGSSCWTTFCARWPSPRCLRSLCRASGSTCAPPLPSACYTPFSTP